MKVLTAPETASDTEGAEWDLKFLFASSQVQIKVHQVMTPQVLMVDVHDNLAEAAGKMAGKGISCAVAMDAGRVSGMLTQKDFLYGLAMHGRELYQHRVADQMTSPVHTVDQDRSVLECCRFMDREGIRRLPVLRGDELVGIVTQTDLTRALTSYGAFREVSEIMSASTVTVHMEDTLAKAVSSMADYHISCIVVLADDGSPVGILTERDVLGKISSRQVDPNRVRVEDVMSSPLTHIDSGYSIHSAARVMDQCHIHRLVVMEDGKLHGVVTQSDIFRAAHQKLLMEEANRFRLLARSANSTFVLNREGQVVYVNQAFLSLLQIDDDRELLGQPFLPESFWVAPEEREPTVDKLRNGDTTIDQMMLKTVHGDLRYVSAITTPTMDTQGESSGTQGVLYDNTARTLAEEATVRANDDLQAANQELKQMQGQIIQNEKLASIGQLAAGVAHEMNTPVGFVASNFQTLEKYMSRFLDLFQMYAELGDAVEDGLKEKRLAIMAKIKEARDAMRIDFILQDLEQLFSESREGLERVTTIIRNLRDFSRVDQVDSQRSFNLNEAIETTLIVARNEIKYSADVEKYLGDVPPIQGNASQINQVLLNLLVNAAQAIAGQERAHDDRGWIRIETHATESHVVCTIEDNGPGIPEAIRERIFDPFFTTKPPGKGTGLGLNVSHDIIVNKHHGQLRVDSTLGRGTVFTLALPFEPPEDDSDVKSPSGPDDENGIS